MCTAYRINNRLETVNGVSYLYFISASIRKVITVLKKSKCLKNQTETDLEIRSSSLHSKSNDNYA